MSQESFFHIEEIITHLKASKIFPDNINEEFYLLLKEFVDSHSSLEGANDVIDLLVNSTQSIITEYYKTNYASTKLLSLAFIFMKAAYMFAGSAAINDINIKDLKEINHLKTRIDDLNKYYNVPYREIKTSTIIPSFRKN